MIHRFRLLTASVVLLGAVAWMPSLAHGADTVQAASKPGDVSCSCHACTQQVCCQAPTGFAPLDDKCRTLCDTKHWVVSDNGSCGTQPGCCPAK